MIFFNHTRRDDLYLSFEMTEFDDTPVDLSTIEEMWCDFQTESGRTVHLAVPRVSVADQRIIVQVPSDEQATWPIGTLLSRIRFRMPAPFGVTSSQPFRLMVQREITDLG